MPVSPTYPGVYVQEVPSGVRTIAGVSTSVAVFIGRATQGPLDTPVLILNYTDFERAFRQIMPAATWPVPSGCSFRTAARSATSCALPTVPFLRK